MSTLVRSGQPDDALDALRAKIHELEGAFGERDAELSRVRAELAAFRLEYRQRVGLLHEQLDDLEVQIAEAELGEISRRLADERRDGRNGGHGGQTPMAETATSPARLTSDAVRKLFRDVARAVHPDLAADELARERRHRLMVEANRAYAMGDEERLRWILQAWERSPDAVQGSDADAARLRLERRVAQLQEQLAILDHDLASAKASPTWQLKTMVDEAAAGGKDLVRDMVERLKRDILVARNRLDAIQSPSSNT